MDEPLGDGTPGELDHGEQRRRGPAQLERRRIRGEPDQLADVEPARLDPAPRGSEIGGRGLPELEPARLETVAVPHDRERARVLLPEELEGLRGGLGREHDLPG